MLTRRSAAKNTVTALTLSIALALGSIALARAESINIETATIADLNKALASGKLTSEKLVLAYMQRIEAYDKKGPTVNSVITLNSKAIEVAKALDAERKAGKVRGPLHGIPYGAKDLLATKGIPTSWGAAPLKEQMFDHDAVVITKLREAGAVLAAKLAMRWRLMRMAARRSRPWSICALS